MTSLAEVMIAFVAALRRGNPLELCGRNPAVLAAPYNAHEGRIALALSVPCRWFTAKVGVEYFWTF